jgi:hypothetical protein
MKYYGRAEVYLSHFCLRHYMEVSGQLHAPAALSPGKQFAAPIVKEAGWAPGSI